MNKLDNSINPQRLKKIQIYHRKMVKKLEPSEIEEIKEKTDQIIKFAQALEPESADEAKVLSQIQVNATEIKKTVDQKQLDQ